MLVEIKEVAVCLFALHLKPVEDYISRHGASVELVNITADIGEMLNRHILDAVCDRKWNC